MARHRAVSVSAIAVAMVALATPAASPVLGASGEVAAGRPNIVVIMVDDMSSELVQYMHEVVDLQSDAVSFTNYFVSSSLCCPSRATYMTGKYPHNTHVQSNTWPRGGFGKFLENDIESSVAPYLSDAGYRTGLLGKYLNEYNPNGEKGGGGAPEYPAGYVPPGWDEFFAVGGNGYQQFHYDAVDSVDGATSVIDVKGNAEENYLTDVISTRTAEFLDRAADHAEPFFLTVVPFAVHGGGGGDPERPNGARYPPAPRDRADSPDRPPGWGEPEFENGDCGDPVDGGCDEVAFPDPSWGSFNQPINHPASHSPKKPLPDRVIATYQRFHTERVQMSQAVNDLIGAVRAELVDAGVAENTYLIFTSDNGYHLGEHALNTGKATPYDHDVRMPLVLRPPGGTTAGTRTKIAQNTDLMPTLLDLADVPVPADVDGQSLLPLVDDLPTGQWRQTAFMEYAGRNSESAVPFAVDPDRETGRTHTPRYVALRTHDYLYADYSQLDSKPPLSRHAEYFDIRTDPFMLDNIYRDLPRDRRIALNDAAIAYDACAGAACWDAGLVAP